MERKSRRRRIHLWPLSSRLSAAAEEEESVDIVAVLSRASQPARLSVVPAAASIMCEKMNSISLGDLGPAASWRSLARVPAISAAHLLVPILSFLSARVLFSSGWCHFWRFTGSGFSSSTDRPTDRHPRQRRQARIGSDRIGSGRPRLGSSRPSSLVPIHRSMGILLRTNRRRRKQQRQRQRQ